MGWLIHHTCHPRMALHLGCALEAQALLTIVKNDHLGCSRLNSLSAKSVLVGEKLVATYSIST